MEVNPHKSLFAILKTAYNTILLNPVILFPLSIMAFIQLFVLEIIFFAPRQPLIGFFRPLILSQGEWLMHYPYNFILLAKWFSQLQVPIYIFCNSFFIGAMVLIIHHINEGQAVDLKKIFRETLSRYSHLILATVLSVLLIIKLNDGYHTYIKNSLLTSSFPLILRKIIFHGDSMIYFSISMMVTTLLAFVIPIIMIEKKNVLVAVAANFRNQLKSIGHVFILIFLPAILYVPVFLLKMSWKDPNALAVPEFMGLLLAGGMLVLLFIDAIQYTAVTTYYLLHQGK